MNTTLFPLAEKIKCNGIKPLKSDVYLLAAELQQENNIVTFKDAVISALLSYDYYYYYYYYGYYHGYYHDYYHDYYYYDHDYCYHDHDYYYYDHNYSKEEKTLALLFLSAIYLHPGE